MYGEPVTCIGYPTNSGTGSSISTGDVLLAMSSKSKYKDGAWEFIRKFLTSDYQNGSDMWSFPIMKSALDAKFKEAMTPEYYEDENGKQVEQVKGSWGYEDFNVDIYAAKQEDIDELNKVITSVDSSFEYNTEMYSIITEETAPFFAGQKTAKEVADIIQSRIQIYVNENR
jgi:ABC-type glycerol-3-phosphate transport system substrate-binding protein